MAAWAYQTNIKGPLGPDGPPGPVGPPGPAGPPLILSDTPPPAPLPGTMWLETDTGNLFAWWVDPDSAAWVQVNVAVPVSDGTGLYDTAAGMAALIVPSSVNAFRTNGYSVVGDGGAALYKRVISEPAHAGKVQTLDGAWWETAEETLTPQMFGAKGDGTTDDTAAINSAFTVSPGILRIPRNVYRLSDAGDASAILFDLDNAILEGDGSGSVLHDPGNVRQIEVSGDNQIIRNLKFTGTQGAGLRVNQFHIHDANNLRLERLESLNASATFIHAGDNIDGLTVTHCRAINFYEGFFDITGVNASRVRITHNYAKSSVSNADIPGVDPIGCSIEPQGSGTYSDLLYAYNQIDFSGVPTPDRNNTVGIYFGDSAAPGAVDVLVTKIRIIGNHIRGVGIGIKAQRLRKGAVVGGAIIQIENNLIEACRAEGMWLTGGPNSTHYDFAQINDNMLYGVSESSSNLYSGIKLDEYWQRPKIENNRFTHRHNESGGTNYKYGIELGATVTDADVSNNSLNNFGTGPYLDSSASAHIRHPRRALHNPNSAMAGNETFDLHSALVLVRNPSGARTLNPVVTALGYFPDGWEIEVVNLSATNTITFDATVLNQVIGISMRGRFVYDRVAALWRKLFVG